MLKLLSTHQEATNGDTILTQYHSYLQGLTDKYAAGREFVPTGGAKDNGLAWQGFLHELAGKLTSLQKLHWQYVPNAQGGFYGMWWGFTKLEQAIAFTDPGKKEYEGVDVYLQLEEDTLTLRAGRWQGEKISSKMRWVIHHFIENGLKKSLENHGYEIISSGRPGRSCRLFKVLPKGANTTFATGTPIESVAQKLITFTMAFDEAMHQKQADNK